MSSDTPQTTAQALETEVSRCLAVAQAHFGRSFRRPQILTNLRGRAAGQARPARWQIRLNAQLLASHPREIIQQTVPHEIAHLIDCAVNPLAYVGRSGTRRQPHGPRWRAIMRLFGVPANRCHDLPVTAASKPRTRMRYLYRCAPCARLIEVGPNHHLLLQQRRAQATLKGCGHSIGGSDYVSPTEATSAVLARRVRRRRRG